jgi:ketosteroid isomerase-like protein
MKSIAVFLAGLLATTQAFACLPPPTHKTEVVRRDRELNALIVAHDATAARDYYDDQFVLSTSSGKSKSKADLLAEIARPGLVLEVNETTEVVVRVRDETAVLTGILHQRGSIDGKAFDVRLRVTDTWVRDHHTGTWVILAGHASVIN